jgi:hypothetical protein
MAMSPNEDVDKSFPPGHDAKFCCRTPTRAAVWWHTNQQYSTETRNHSTDTPQIAQKVQKYTPGAPNIENVIENVIVFLYFWKYKTRKQKYIVSGLTFRVLYFWKYKSTIKYNFDPDKVHPYSLWSNYHTYYEGNEVVQEYSRTTRLCRKHFYVS